MMGQRTTVVCEIDKCQSVFTDEYVGSLRLIVALCRNRKVFGR